MMLAVLRCRLQVAPPMLPGNYESSNLACIIGEDLRAAVVQVRLWCYYIVTLRHVTQMTRGLAE